MFNQYEYNSWKSANMDHGHEYKSTGFSGGVKCVRGASEMTETASSLKAQVAELPLYYIVQSHGSYLRKVDI